MDDTETKEQTINTLLEDTTAAVHERIASLDAPVRELLLSDQYVITLGEIAKLHGLENKDIGIVEEITTNFLLGTIRPSELEQNYIHDLSHLTKEKIQSLHKDIRVKILSPIWNIIESAWAEDDENEKIFNEVIEIADIPLPPNLANKGIETLGQKINKELDQGKKDTEIIQSIRPNKTMAEADVVGWEDKLKKQISENKDPIVTNRTTTDVSLPDTDNDTPIKTTVQITKPNKDSYREATEE